MKNKVEPKFIPNNLDEILDWLDKNVSQDQKDFFLREEICIFHHYTGRAMRNDWNLWSQKNKIGQHFLSIGIFHADDRSAIIMESFRRRLLGEPIELDKQVKHYQDFWAKTHGAESKVTIERNKKTGEYKIIQGK